MQIIHKVLFLTFLFWYTHTTVGAQEFILNVTVQAPNREDVSVERYEALERELNDYINNTAFTNISSIKDFERLEGSISLVITEEVDQENFKSDLFIQVLRPVYGSSYLTQVINYRDEGFQFRFLQDQPFEFNSQFTFQNNLTSTITYYLFTALALDFDSYSPMGGQPYWLNNNLLIENIPSAGSDATGWDPTERIGRIAITTNALDPNYVDFRRAWYMYHRKGLDYMHMNPEEGRANIMEALKLLSKVNQNNPNQMLMQMFFDAKHTEIASIFEESTSAEKAEAYELLVRLDPLHKRSYNNIRS